VGRAHKRASSALSVSGHTAHAYSPLPRARALILGSLLVLAAGAWAVLVWQSSMTDPDDMDNMLTMDLGVPLFLGIWVAMMVAMMFPTAAPMILTFASVHQKKQHRGKPYVPTWVFVSSYLAIWTTFGALTYAAAVGATELADNSMWVMDNAAPIGGGVLILAGLYQLSPLKHVCLSKCRAPMAFVLTSWRDGYGGALRMGLEHGLYCLGCCWLFFVIVFPLGMMNVAVLAAIVLLIFAEKSLPFGHRASQLAAAALVGYGTLVILVPDALPTAM
jgi:predicted metal-binding membrane protein